MVNKIKQYGSFLAGSVGVFALLYYGYSKGSLAIIEGDWLFYAECMVIIPLCFMLAFKMLGRKYLKHQGSLGKIMIPLILILVVLMVTMAIYYDQMIKVTIQLFSISFFIVPSLFYICCQSHQWSQPSMSVSLTNSSLSKYYSFTLSSHHQSAFAS